MPSGNNVVPFNVNMINKDTDPAHATQQKSVYRVIEMKEANDAGDNDDPSNVNMLLINNDTDPMPMLEQRNKSQFNTSYKLTKTNAHWK